jgi:hypothetical protein
MPEPLIALIPGETGQDTGTDPGSSSSPSRLLLVPTAPVPHLPHGPIRGATRRVEYIEGEVLIPVPNPHSGSPSREILIRFCRHVEALRIGSPDPLFGIPALAGGADPIIPAALADAGVDLARPLLAFGVILWTESDGAPTIRTANVSAWSECSVGIIHTGLEPEVVRRRIDAQTARILAALPWRARD